MPNNQIPESDLIQLIARNLKHQIISTGNPTMTPRGVYGQIKADIERQGYDIAILYRVIEVMWNMSTTGILIPIKYAHFLLYRAMLQ